MYSSRWDSVAPVPFFEEIFVFIPTDFVKKIKIKINKKTHLVVNVWLCSRVLSSVPFVVYVMDLMDLCNTI